MKLEIQGLSKTYSNGVKALDDISLSIPTGMFGLLGPNGAGKSSLMRTIATLQIPDSGTVLLDDIDVQKEPGRIRQLLGYLPQEFGVYPRVSPLQLLNHLAILKGITNKKQRAEIIGALLDRVNLYAFRKKAINSFSGGMKQRFGIAQALLGEPKLLIVDEPTAGLDPGERNRFHNLLSETSEETIVILSTHIVDDVRELCSQMAIIDRGRLIFTGTPSLAQQSLEGSVWKKLISRNELDRYRQRYSVLSSKFVAGNPLIHVLSPDDPGEGFQAVEPDLEDVFFAALQKRSDSQCCTVNGS